MEVRTIAALLLALVTLAAVTAAFFYATRDSRAERRASKRGERMRVRRNAERIAAEEGKVGDAA